MDGGVLFQGCRLEVCCLLGGSSWEVEPEICFWYRGDPLS